MLQIIIIPAKSNAAASLYFKTTETAEAAHTEIAKAQSGALPSQVLKITDDFGHVLTIDKENISYALLMDSYKQQELQAWQSSVMNGAAKPKSELVGLNN